MFNLIWKSRFVKETTQHLCSSSNNVHAHEGNKSMEILGPHTQQYHKLKGYVTSRSHIQVCIIVLILLVFDNLFSGRVKLWLAKNYVDLSVITITRIPLQQHWSFHSRYTCLINEQKCYCHMLIHAYTWSKLRVL